MRNTADHLGASKLHGGMSLLLESLSKEPWQWDYFQALRTIDALNPHHPRIGTSARPADEAIRLGQDPSLSFAPSSLSSLRPGSAGRPPRILVRFFGLFGPNGPLPLHLSELARNRHPTSGVTNFSSLADLIHHRFLSLFYRAWAQAQPTVSLDRPRDDRFGTYIASLAGLGLSTLRDRDSLPDSSKLSHAGLLSRQVRNAESLENLLSDHFSTSIVVEPFNGHWMALRERDRSRLGMRTRLGRDAIAGQHVWDRQHKFRLRIGPLTLSQYLNFLPGESGSKTLVAAVRNFVGHEFEWDARLVLRVDQIPKLRLDGKTRLGYTTWIGPRASCSPASDLVLNIQDSPA